MASDRRAHLPSKGATLPGIFRPSDLEKRGSTRHRIQTMLRRGEASRVARGLYRLTSAAPNEHVTIAMVSKRVPRAVICLLTALHMHGIGTQAPKEVWIALDRKARKPRLSGLSVRVVRFSGRMLTHAVVTREVLGVTIRITSPARTVVDCFRYRRKIGLDVAMEALHDAIRSRQATVDEITRIAHVCRAGTVIMPYLQSLVA